MPPEARPRRVVVRQVFGGGLGNRMFEHMLASALVRRIPGAVLTGDALPEWGIAPKRIRLPARHIRLTGGHRIEIQRLIYLARSGLIDGIETLALGCRMELLEPLRLARPMFRSEVPPQMVCGPDRLLIGIRGGDILRGVHKDYRPLPLAFYERLLAETGLRPVFMGQIGEDAYGAALRARFPGAEFLPERSPMEDFATLRAASHLCIAVSTFSWLAAWLSRAETIHLPVAGMFHPAQRPDVDLLPVADPRYRFHLFDPGPWTATEAEFAAAIHGAEAGHTITRDEALRLVAPKVVLEGG